MKQYQMNVRPYKGMQIVDEELDTIFEWNGANWFDMETRSIPPLNIVARLNTLARQELLGHAS